MASDRVRRAGAAGRGRGAGPEGRGRAAPRRVARLVAAAGVLVAGAACGEPGKGRPAAPAAVGPAPIRFEEVAEASGMQFRMAFLPGEQGEQFKINFYDHGCGVAVADVEGDGDDDVYFCNQLGRNALFLNDGRGRFTEVAERAGVAVGDRICVAATFADVDGDGDQDLYVTTTRAGNLFFRNRGDGTFEDATAAAGLELVAHSEQAVFFDADRDGDLDLFVSNTAEWTTSTYVPEGRYYTGNATLLELLQSPPERSRFYRNRGDSTFEDATEAAGLACKGWAGDPAVLDVDDDGDLDLFVCNMFGRSSLFVNDGTGRFTDETPARLGRVSWGAVAAKAFDYSGDGRLDLMVVDMHSDMWMDFGYDPASQPEGRKFGTMNGPNPLPADLGAATARLFGERDVVYGSTLFRANGDGTFVELSDVAGTDTMWPWGIAAADYDADGHEDAFVPTGMGYPYRYWRAPLLWNRGNGTFADVAAGAGLDPLPGGTLQAQKIGNRDAARSTRSAAVGDFDGDGRPDVVVNLFNDRAMLFRNRSPERAWVGFRLVGPGRGRDAVGAVVRVRAGARTFVRQVDGAGGYLAQSSRTLHVGLGDRTAVDGVEVRWPDGTVERTGPVELRKVHRLVHPKAR